MDQQPNMPNQQLIDYIKQAKAVGQSDEQIKQALLAAGWQGGDINEAIGIVLGKLNQQSPAVPSGSLPGALAILKEAWFAYRLGFATFLAIAAVPVVFGLVFTLLAGAVAASIPFLIKLSGYALIGIAAGAIIFVILSVFLMLWSRVALLFAIKDRQEKIGIKESYKKAWGKITAYFWIAFLSGIVTVGGFVLFIVPGIIFSVWFSLASFVFVAEGEKGMNALLKSKEYVRGLWGKILWRFFFIGTITFALSFIADYAGELSGVALIKDIPGFIVSLLLTPLIVVYSFLVYEKVSAFRGAIVFIPSKDKKALFVFIGALGLALIPAIFIAVAYFGFNSVIKTSPSPTPASLSPLSAEVLAGWQTYKNEQYGFEVKYPNSVALNVKEDQAVSSIPEDLSKKLFSIGINEPGHGAPFFDAGSSEIISVDGINLTKRIDWDPVLFENADSRYKDVVLQNINVILAGNIGATLYFSCADKKESCIALFNQILSTFKFIPR